MFAVDLHTHTRFFHGFDALGRRFDPVGVRLLARVARARGLDAVVTTNHDFYRAFEGVDAVAVLPGIEVTTTRGHVLVVGPDPPERTEPGALTPEETVEMAHDRDCAAIVAHPFRNSTVREADADFDALEVNGKGTEPIEWVERLAGELDLPLVAGSDAHYPVEVGRAFTLVGEGDPSTFALDGAPEGETPTAEAVVSAIRDGDVRAYVDRRPSQRLLRRAYRFTHGRKGWVDPPDADVDAPGLGAPPGERESAPPSGR